MMKSRLRRRRTRWSSHPGLILATLALTGMSLAQERAPSDQAPAIKVQVNQVLVPVIVTDRKGHFVTDLKASDFQVFEDGIEQKVSDFRNEKDGASELFTAEASPVPPTGGSFVLSQPNGEFRPRFTYVIVLDTLFSTFGDFTQVRNALEKLFKEEAGSGSEYALVALGRTTMVLQNFTGNPELILAALGKKETTKAILSSETSNLVQQEIELRQRLEQDCSDVQTPPPPNSKGKNTTSQLPCGTATESILAQANADAEERDILTRNFLQDLRNLTQQLSGMPGRRVVVMTSDGFNLQPGRELFEMIVAFTNKPSMLLRNPTEYLTNEMRAIVRSATAHDVTFYTLDSRGLYAPPVGGIDISEELGGITKNPTALPNVMSAKQTADLESQDAMNYLATATGGVFYHDSNDLLKGFRQAFADGRQYYVLAYYSSNRAADGKFRTIEVRVKGKNLIARAKPGYWAPVATMVTVATPEHGEPSVLAVPARARNIPTVPQTNTVEPSFIPARAPSVVDLPIADVIREVPELKNLQPATNQDLLASILQKVGAKVATFFENFPNITCREKVVEQRQIVLRSLEDETVQDFHYLALPSPDRKQVALEEYRTDPKGHTLNQQGLDQGYVITEGFVSIPLNFHPVYQPYSRFRYLGQEEIGKREMYVVAFAQKPSSPRSALFAVNGAKPLTVLTQGVAWIDPASHEIVRMWTGLLTSVPEIKLRSQTTLIQFEEVRFKGTTSGLWLPREVRVETRFTDASFRNTHSYSEFKQFTVQTQGRQAAPVSQ